MTAPAPKAAPPAADKKPSDDNRGSLIRAAAPATPAKPQDDSKPAPGTAPEPKPTLIRAAPATSGADTKPPAEKAPAADDNKDATVLSGSAKPDSPADAEARPGVRQPEERRDEV